MKRRALVTTAGGTMALALTARAQQPARLRRIGCLTMAAPELPAPRQLIGALRQGLRDLGYVEGQNFAFEFRSADGRIERFADLAADLVRLNVDLIAAFNNAAANAAHRATRTIPIVSFNLGDPLAEGLAASLTQPGGNVTGFTIFAVELAPRALFLLNQTMPAAKRIAGLWFPGSLTERTGRDMLQQLEAAARELQVEFQTISGRTASDIDDAFSRMVAEGFQAVLVLPSPLTNVERHRIAALALRHRLPSISWMREFAEAGGLMSYGSNLAESWRRGAGYIDKIFNGARPAELPIQQPTSFEFVINARTAKALQLAIPAAVLARADEVIE